VIKIHDPDQVYIRNGCILMRFKTRVTRNSESKTMLKTYSLDLLFWIFWCTAQEHTFNISHRKSQEHELSAHILLKCLPYQAILHRKTTAISKLFNRSPWKFVTRKRAINKLLRNNLVDVPCKLTIQNGRVFLCLVRNIWEVWTDLCFRFARPLVLNILMYRTGTYL
jgi:hypothetical protein